ncbi:MAG: DNA-3-methyladenine glycosylase I [Flavonifractor plautii]
MGEGARCPWAKTEHEILYHDTEWCRPCRDDRALFELLELEGFQAGLSWKLILERRAPAGGLRGF